MICRQTPTRASRHLYLTYLDVQLNHIDNVSVFPLVINSDTIHMSKVEDIIERMKSNPRGIDFKDMCKVCEAFFGAPRVSSSSHRMQNCEDEDG